MLAMIVCFLSFLFGIMLVIGSLFAVPADKSQLVGVAVGLMLIFGGWLLWKEEERR